MNDLTLAIRLTTEGGKVIVKDFTDIRAAADEANKSLLKSEPSGVKANAGFRQAGSGAKAAKTDIDATTRSIDGMVNKLKLLVGGVSFTLLSREVKDYADIWKLANNQLRQVSDTEQILINSRRELLSVARATNTDLLGTVELYASFERGTRSLGLSQKSVIDITTTMNNLLLAGGKSAQETSGAIRQLNQGLESGALRGDEFNSVAEGAPRVLDALSNSLEISRGELRDFAATGGITSQILATALLEYQGTAQHMADITVRTFDQQMNNAKTNIIEFVGQSQFLNDAVDNAGSGLVFLSQNIEALTHSLGAAAAVYIASFIPSLTSSIAAQYQAAVAAQQNTVAQAEKAKVLLAATVSATSAATAEASLAAAHVASLKTVIGQLEAEAALENVRLKAQITQQGRIMTASRMAEIQAARTAIVKQLTAAEAQLLITNQSVAAASGAQSAATVSLATAQTAATRTSYALGVASRFLLGPFGLLLTAVGAATAAFYLSAEASEADEKAKKKQAEAATNLLDIYDALRDSNPQTFSERYVEAQQTAIDIDTQRIALEQKMAALRKEAMEQYDPSLIIKKMQDVENQLNILHEAELANNSALEAMQGSFDKGIEALESWEKPAKEVVKFTSDINAELDALIDTLDPAGAALRQYGTDYDVLLAAYADGNITYEKTISLINLLDTQFAKQTEVVDKLDDANKKYIQSLTDELELTKYFGKELVVQTALQKLNADATAEQRSEVEKLAAALFDQEAATKALDLSDLTSQVNEYGNAWGSVGNVIIDTFGSVADQFERFAEQQSTYIEQLDLIKEKREVQASNPDIEGREKALKELSAYEFKLNEQNLRSQLGAFSSIAGAASQMFDEQSKGREVLHKAEQLFTIIEIGLAFKKAAANALVAVTNQGSGDPYSAFGRIAAMIGIMAGLGLAVSGSSSGGSMPTAQQNQDSQGTGSVFGDGSTKSGSINALSERFEDLEVDQLAALLGIRQDLQGLTGGIAQLTRSVVSGLNFDGGFSGEFGTKSTTSAFADFMIAGGPLGDLDPTGLVNALSAGFASTKKELLDSGITFFSQTLGEVLASGQVEASVYADIQTTKKKWWGLSKSTNVDTDFQSIDSAITAQMADIFGFVGDSIIDAAKLLGFDSVEITTTSILRSFNNDDYENLRNGTFNWGQRFSEVVTNTTSMSLEDALSNFTIDLPKISFKDLSGEEIQAELEAVFSQQADLIAEYLVPAISQYQQIGEGAYETLLRVAQEQVVFNNSLERMGITLGDLSNVMAIDVSQSIITLMGGLDAFKDASNAYFSEFFSEQEQFEYLQRSLGDALASVNLALPESKAAFRDLVESMDPLTEEGQRLIALLLQVSPAAAEYYDQLEKQTGVLQDNTSLLAERAKYENSIADALARMDYTALQTALVDLNGWYQAQIDQAAALGADTTLLEQLYARKRTDVIAAALEQVNRDTQEKMDALTSIHESAVNQLTSDYEQLFASMASVSASISDGILSIRRSMSGWNEIGYQSNQISTLRSQLGQGSISDQTSTVQSLYDATMARYQAEIDNNNRLSDAANARYEADLANYQTLKQAAEGLKKAADSLLLSDFSYLSQGDQLAEAQRQFAAAQKSGDASLLQSVGQDYLKIAQEYYSTGSNQYGDIFDQVQGAFKGASAGRAPSAPREVIQYQNDNLAIQENALLELANLQTLLDELNAQALAEQQSELQSLQESFDLNLTAMLAAQLDQTNAIQSMSSSIVAAIESIDVAPVIVVPPAPVVTVTKVDSMLPGNNTKPRDVRDPTPSTQSAPVQNNDAVVAQLKVLGSKLDNVSRDLGRTNDMVFKKARLA